MALVGASLVYSFFSFENESWLHEMVILLVYYVNHPFLAVRYFIYWVPNQYVDCIKEAILGKWNYF